MKSSISITEFNKLENIKNIIDIRSVEKYNFNHISEAINIQLDKLIVNPSKYLSKDTIYYIYCQKGIQSRKLCSYLRGMGYNVINIQGGYEAWILTK